MANDYLAIYIAFEFRMGQIGNVSAIRHFSSTKGRLADAISRNAFFTDMDDVRKEAHLVANANQIVVLMDSIFPGRKKVMPLAATTNIWGVMTELKKIDEDHSKPLVSKPVVSDISIRSGMRNMSFPRPYKRGIVDNTNFKGGVFDISLSESEFEILPIRALNEQFLFMVVFRNWNRIELNNF